MRTRVLTTVVASILVVAPLTAYGVTVTNTTQATIYATIQAAVDDANPNDVISVAAGSHLEPTQVVIDKNLTLKGAGAGLTTIEPGFNTSGGSYSPTSSIILVDSGVTATIEYLAINGSGHTIQQAIQARGADLTVRNCEILNIYSSIYEGRGIVFLTGTGLVENCTMSNIQRIGVHIRGGAIAATAPVVTVDGLQYTGKGDGDFLDYGIEFGGGGQGVATNCVITDCRGVASSDGSTSAAILATDYYGTGTIADVNGCTLNDNSTGIYAGYTAGDTTVLTASDCNLANNGLGVISVTATTVDASPNWWGDIYPANDVSGDVDYYPCYTDALMTATFPDTLVVDSGWTAFVIRENATEGPPLIWGNDVYVADAVEVSTFASSQKAALGTDAISGVAVGQIATLYIDRLDNVAASESQWGPYFNIWVTDGLGNYAVLANEPSDAEWACCRWDMPSWDFLKTKRCKVYETTGASGGQPGTSWVATHTGLASDLIFEDVADLIIEAPPVAYILAGNGIGSGAPDELGTNLAYGFNWVFGDTAANYVTGTGEGFVVADYAVTATYPVNNVTQGTGYNAIQPAIDAANPGDEITVAAGTYAEDIVIDTAITLTGDGPGSTTLMPAPAKATGPAITVNADNVVISQMTIADPTQLGEGIQVNASANLTVDQVHFPNLGDGAGNAYGVRILNDFTGLTVTDCAFVGTNLGSASRAIGLFCPNHLQLSNLEVHDSVFEYLFVGIYWRSAIDGFNATGNTFGPFELEDCTAAVAGIYIGDGDDNNFDLLNISVTGNTFTDYGRGVYVWNYGASSTIGNFVISGNTFTNSIWSSAVRFILGLNGMEDYSIAGIDISNNTYTQNTEVGANVALVDLRTYDATLLACNVAVTNNDMTFTGGPYTDAMYGVQFMVGGDGFYNTTVAENFISGGGTGGAGSPTSSGVVIRHYSSYAPWGHDLSLDINNNTIMDFDNGVSVYDIDNALYGGLPTGTAVSINDNNILNNTMGVRSGPGEVVNAENNNWGDSSGPYDPSGTVEIDANTSPCPSVADALNADGSGNGVTDLTVSYCPWLLAPATLTLTPDATCYDSGATIQVAIEMSGVIGGTDIVGGDFFLAYDETKLDFVSATPGSATFPNVIKEIVNEGAGEIDYSVGVPLGGTGTQADTTMAILEFDALVDVCDAAGLVEFRSHTPESKLSDEFGNAVYASLIDLEAITVDSTPPTTTSGPLVVTGGNVDGACDATVTFSATVTDDCCLDAADVAVGVTLTTGNATMIYVPASDLTVTQVNGQTVEISGEVTVSDLTSCPATVEVTVDAMDCCGNVMTQVVETGDVWDNTAPVVTPLLLPPVNADAGNCDAEIALMASATDNCATLDSADIDFTIDVDGDGFGGADDQVVNGSGSTYIFPAGTTDVRAEIADDCGNVGSSDFTITVNDVNTMDVDLALAGTLHSMASPTLTRCITFELWDCGGAAPPEVVTEEITFDTSTGLGNAVVEIPCGNYTCITVRDELHTLRRTVDSGTYFGISGTKYFADFVGAGADLIGGNYNDDMWIDILDFGVFSWQWAQNYGTGDTTCDPFTAYPHADVDGSGHVDSVDFGFIQTNYFKGSEPNCCGALNRTAGGANDGPVSSITLKELRQLGLGRLSVADLNRDRKLDSADLAAFMAGERPKPMKPIRIDRLQDGQVEVEAYQP